MMNKMIMIGNREVNVVDNDYIAKRFSGLVASYLQNGFYFDINHNSGTQGEVKNAVLTDGNKCYKIYANREYFEFNYVFALYVKTYDVSKGTLWNSEGTEIFSEKFYRMGDSDKYITELVDFNEYIKIRNERRNKRYEIINLAKWSVMPKSVNKVALRIIKNMRGFKSVKASDINRVERMNNRKLQYEVFFNKGCKKTSCTISM